MVNIARNIGIQHDIDKQNELRLPTLKEIFRGLTGQPMREKSKSASKLEKQVMIKRVVLKSIIQSYISSGITTEAKLKKLGIDAERIIHPLPGISVSGLGSVSGSGGGAPDAPIDLSSVPQASVSIQGLRTELTIIETQIRQVMAQHPAVSEERVDQVYNDYINSIVGEEKLDEIAENLPTETVSVYN